jgi:hypothetical protein
MDEMPVSKLPFRDILISTSIKTGMYMGEEAALF